MTTNQKTDIEIQKPKLCNSKNKVNSYNNILTENKEQPKDNRNNTTPGAVKSILIDNTHTKDNQQIRHLNTTKQTNKQRTIHKTSRKRPPQQKIKDRQKRSERKYKKSTITTA